MKGKTEAGVEPRHRRFLRGRVNRVADNVANDESQMMLGCVSVSL